VQTEQKRTQKQSYKTHPHLPETEATLVFVLFWFPIMTYNVFGGTLNLALCICLVLVINRN